MALSSGLCVQLSAAVVEELKKHGIYTGEYGSELLQ